MFDFNDLKTKSFQKNLTYNLIIWLIPFIISIPFFNSDGKLLIDEKVFNTFIIVIFLFSFLFFFKRFAQKHVNKNKTKHLIHFGITTLITNAILDLIILVGLLQTTLNDWISLILPIYLIPIAISYVVYRLTPTQITKK